MSEAWPGRAGPLCLYTGPLPHRACLRQATDDELRLAHSADHVAYVDGPPGPDDWVVGDNYFSEATPVAARTAAGCTVQVGALGGCPATEPVTVPGAGWHQQGLRGRRWKPCSRAR